MPGQISSDTPVTGGVESSDAQVLTSHDGFSQIRHQASSSPESTDATEVPRAHAPHGFGTHGPHFDVQQAIAEKEEASKCGPNWVSLMGQFLAYAGVLGLTLGTSLVLWGYFGGPAHYAPTGWLITTAGQMLLFLGVVTLVSGGMEQTTEQVSRKIDTLGDRLLRIELASHGHQLGGPKLPSSSFANKAKNRESTNQSISSH